MRAPRADVQNPWIRRSAALLSLGLVGAALVAGLRSGGLPRADFVFNNGAEVASLDPARVTGVPEGRILRAILEGLVVRHPQTLEPLPGSAERWEVSPDGLRWTFAIRPEARWSNGDPLGPEDFAWSFLRLLDPATASQYAYLLWPVRGARAYSAGLGPREAVGIRAAGRELALELERPAPGLLEVLAYFPLYPVHRASLERARSEFPDTWELEWLRPERLVSNGPFRIVERRLNDRIRMVRSESYWDRGAVALASIDALAIEHSGTALNLYLTGGLDLVSAVPAAAVPRLLGREDFRPAPFLGSYFYRVNVTRPPFDDRRVRRALALSIDRRAICERITRAGEGPLASLVPPGIRGWKGAALELAPGDGGFRSDLARARELLAEAVAAGAALRPIEIHFNTDPDHRDIAEFVADTWRKELGLEVLLANEERKVALDTQQALRYDVSRSVWIADYPDPATFLEIFASGSENNRTGWADARYDALLDAAAREADAVRRLELLAEAEARLLEELPILPIYAYVTRNLVSPRLGGFHENALDEHFPKFLHWQDGPGGPHGGRP